jgi:hypothetical protein
MGFLLNQHRPRFHLTLQEAATRFAVSPQLLTAGIRHCRLPFKRAMHRSWVTPRAVASYIEMHGAHAHTPWNSVGAALPARASRPAVS